MRTRLSSNSILYSLSTLYVSVVRGTPLLVQILFIWLALPQIWPGFGTVDAFIMGTFAVAFNYGAYMSEIFRAGIQAVSKGQTEAASALGLRPGRVMSLVVLPQALRVIIPPLISQYLNITKNSSLAIAVGYADITATLGGITLNQTGRAIECVLLLMLFYLTISLSISGIMNVYNNAVKLKER